MFDPVVFQGVGGGGGGGFEPVLLWQVDHATAGVVDWLTAAPASLNGMTITPFSAGPPASWGTDGVNGLVVDDDGVNAAFGRFEIAAGTIATYAATGSRPLTRLDEVVMAVEWQAATPTTVGSQQFLEIWAAFTGPLNYNLVCGVKIDTGPAISRRIGLWNWPPGWRTINSLGAVTSAVMSIGVDRAQGWTTTDSLTGAALPDVAGAAGYGPVQMPGLNFNKSVNRTGAAQNWSIVDSVGTPIWQQNKAANEPVAMFQVRSQLWVLPGGLDYEAP